MAEIPIERLAKHIGDNLEETAKNVKFQVMRNVTFDTIVDTGRLRGNWQCTNGSPAVGTIERFDASGNSVESEIRRTVKSDTIDFLTNNLPYAEVLEERDGMVARNVARLERTIREAAK